MRPILKLICRVRGHSWGPFFGEQIKGKWTTRVYRKCQSCERVKMHKPPSLFLGLYPIPPNSTEEAKAKMHKMVLESGIKPREDVANRMVGEGEEVLKSEQKKVKSQVDELIAIAYGQGRVAGLREAAALLSEWPHANYLIAENLWQLQDLATKIEQEAVKQHYSK